MQPPEPPPPRRRRALAAGAALAALALAIVVGRVLHDGRRALVEGDAARAAGRLDDALFAWHLAARAYVPGGPYGDAAAERLVQAGASAEASADLETARRAYEALRSAALGARSLFTPYARALARAEERLAVIYAALDARARAGVAGPAAVQAEHAARLRARPGPPLRAVLLSLLGLTLWVSAALVFIARGLGPALAIRAAPALACAVTFVLGVALFVLGLSG